MTKETRMNRRDERRPGKLTLAQRRWAYGVLAAAGALALTYGLLSAEELAAWLVLGSALLGVTGLALANPTRD